VAQRADVLRNHAAVLAATEALFDRDDLDRVTLARIAEAAGVGKATVLRHFGDVGGVVEAVLAPKVIALQDAVSAGDPPLGPGGSPHDGLHAFLDALFDFVLDNRALIRALEHRRPNAYYANPASQFWIGELNRRIRRAMPTVDTDYLAHVVFTALRADIIDYLRTDQHMTIERIRAGLHALLNPHHVAQ
jgi:AcrR family transcriptional regulator